MDVILDAFIVTGDRREKTLAYVPATAYHETGRRMVPVREGFKTPNGTVRVYVQRNYGHKGKDWYCWPAGPYGNVYYGRGIVQLTWHENYVKSSKDAGVDLEKHPDKALDPVIGARLLHAGLIDGRWNGRGKGIEHYLPTNGKDDLRNARRTVNVTDKWDQIGRYYRAFLKAIKEAGGVPMIEAPGNEPFAPVIPRPKPPQPDKPDPAQHHPKPHQARQ